MNNRWKRPENRHKLNAETLFHLLAGSCVTNSIGSYGRQFSAGACDSVEQGDELSLKYLSAVFAVKCKPSAKVILFALADHANEKGVCWPSTRHLSEKCRICKTGVINHINYLEAKGLIKVDKSKRYNVYTLQLDTIPKSGGHPQLSATDTTDCPQSSVTPNETIKSCTPPEDCKPWWQKLRDECGF